MDSTSASLLERLQQRDAQEDWARLVQVYTPLLFSWGKRIGLSSADAEDLVQDVLLVLINKLSQFQRRGDHSFRAWLRTVALNKARERFRRATPAMVSGETQQIANIAAAAESDPFWEADYRQHLIARALAVMQGEFEPRTWQACWQRIVEDRTAKEVAANLGISEGAVYVYSGRVLRRLREELSDLLD